MKITFYLSTGRNLMAEIPDFNSAQFATDLDNPKKMYISVGNSGFAKHTLMDWHETIDETTN